MAKNIPSEITTIKVEKETKKRLDHLKEHEKESYEEVLKKLLYLVNVFSNNPAAGSKILKNIERTRKRHDLFNNQKVEEKKSTLQNNNPNKNERQKIERRKFRIS